MGQATILAVTIVLCCLVHSTQGYGTALGDLLCTCKYNVSNQQVDCSGKDKKGAICLPTGACNKQNEQNCPGSCYKCLCNKFDQCTNKNNGIVCKCPAGYGGTLCKDDVDECKYAHTNDCADQPFGKCTNTVGSYKCTCNPGMKGNGYTCTDIDECANSNSNNCGANAECINTIGSYKCHCKAGWTGNGQTCKDVNECALSTTCNCHQGSSHICVNTPGSYQCKCAKGYTGDGYKCDDINECSKDSLNNCDNNAVCTNTVGSYKCKCKPGFTGNGITCKDINECSKSSLNKCDKNAVCTNTPGSYTCKCKPGYSGDGFTSKDINECSKDSLNKCEKNAVCTNTVGSYTCKCKPGYTGNGFSCKDINECSKDSLNKCDRNAVCTNTPGSYTCKCKPGYSGDGFTCKDINECSKDSLNDCDKNADCTNTVGSYTCKCKKGFIGNGFKCQEITYSSCACIYKENPAAKDGPYTLKNAAGELYTVYCEFYPTHIYTFVKPTELESINIDDLYNNKQEVLIRHRLNNGTQRQVKYGQITKYRDLDISIQYNKHVGYKKFLNKDMGPFIYMGLIPENGINHKGDTQGYNVNGVDYTFKNCDGNPNNYFVLLFNKNNKKFNGYKVDRAFMKKWITDSTVVPADRKLPVEYFSLFEMHFGGCGGYLVTDQVPGLAGVTIGLRYDFPLSSCKDVYDKAGPKGPVSGEYYLTNCEDQKYKVYCEFYSNYFYTFVAPTSNLAIPVNDLYNNENEVLVRYRLKDCRQKQVTLKQIKRYSSRNISIQYNSNLNYNPIRNKQMSPYMYMGFLPKFGINHKGDTQGYNVNGQDKTFKNCDGNANSYFAVLYNAAQAKSNPYSVNKPLMRHWISQAKTIARSQYIPENYFSFFEMHMGGCGGYITSDDFPYMAGVVFGLKYELH